MKEIALMHRPKSEYAYAYDQDILHITFRAAKFDLKKVEIIYGDPFNWTNIDKRVLWVSQVDEMNLRYQTRLYDYFFISIKPIDKRCKYAFILTDNNDNRYFYGSKKLEKLKGSIITTFSDNEEFDLSNYYNYPYINFEDLAETPNWVKDTIWYQIFPDRFYNFTNTSNEEWGVLPVNNKQIFGGNLKGVIKKIPYLEKLGITGIYLTPIFEADTAHKYDTINYFKIDPSFGTNKDFKDLVITAHKANIKIMLDGVFNHSGYAHPFFLDLIKKNEASIYKDAYFVEKFPVRNFALKNNRPVDFDSKNLNYRTFAYTPHMPKWNTDNKLVQKHLLDVVTYWIKEYDIDGWRLDVSNEISHDFLRQIKKAARNAKKETYILGENWDQSLPWLRGDQVDAVMNYDLSNPIWEYLEHKIDLTTFINQINKYLALTPKNVINNMFNLIDSHDTIRIKRRLDDNIDRTKLAYLLMFVSAGAPNIYYGGEIGLTGEHDPDNRRCMIWDEDKQDMDFYRFIKLLIKLRKKYSSFLTADYKFINSEHLVFTKESNDDSILVAINNTNKTINIDLDSNYQNNYLDLFSKKTDFYDKIQLEPYKFIILKKEN